MPRFPFRARRRAAPSCGDLRRLDRQPGRVVRLLRLRGLRALFRQRVLSGQRSGRPAAERGDSVCLRLHRAADRRLAVRPPRRSLRPAQRADAVGAADVLRIADDCGDADLRVNRHRRAGPARPRAHDSGAEPRRRVRHQRDLPHRGRRREAPRLLFQLPVRHADRRAVVRHPGAAAPAAGVPHPGAAEGMGLADSVRRSARCSRLSRC